MSLMLVTPADLPVTVDDVRANSRIDDTDNDALIEGMIKAAMGYAEQWSSRKFAAATWDFGLSAFPLGSICLPLEPVTSVTSIAYLDSHGAPQTVTGYTLTGSDVSFEGGWPPGTEIVVRFVAGEGVPHEVRQAILLLVGHWYESRETAGEAQMHEIPMGAHALLNLHRKMFV